MSGIITTLTLLYACIYPCIDGGVDSKAQKVCALITVRGAVSAGSGAMVGEMIADAYMDSVLEDGAVLSASDYDDLSDRVTYASQMGTTLAHMFGAGLTGTSTGSIIALGISCKQHYNPHTHQFEDGPYTPSEILEVYKTITQKVFVSWSKGNFLRNVKRMGLFKGLLSCFGCCALNRNCMGTFGPKYDNATLGCKPYCIKRMLPWMTLRM